MKKFWEKLKAFFCSTDKHSFEWLDIAADALGILVFLAATFINIG